MRAFADPSTGRLLKIITKDNSGSKTSQKNISPYFTLEKCNGISKPSRHPFPSPSSRADSSKQCDLGLSDMQLFQPSADEFRPFHSHHPHSVAALSCLWDKAALGPGSEGCNSRCGESATTCHESCTSSCGNR